MASVRIGAFDAEDVLLISGAAEVLGEMVARTLRGRFPGLAVEEWAEAATAEIFASCQDVAACAVFAHTGEMP